MNNKIKVSVCGANGCGKTTLAAIVYKHLQELGFSVEYNGYLKRNGKTFEKVLGSLKKGKRDFTTTNTIFINEYRYKKATKADIEEEEAILEFLCKRARR